MARIFMDGFEHGKPNIGNLKTPDPYDSMWIFGGGGTFDVYSGATTDAYNGGLYSVQFSIVYIDATYTYAKKILDSTYNKLFARFYHKPLYGSNQAFCFFAFDDGNAIGSGQSMQLKANGYTGDLTLYVNGTLQSTVVGIVPISVWKLIEVMYDYNTSNIIVKIDDSVVIDYSGTIDANIDSVFIGKSDGTFLVDDVGCRIDDFALNDDSGTVNNSWIGAGVIRLLKPISDDTNADFSPSTGVDHYALVDDFPDDGDTTHNSSITSGDIDTFNLESVPSVIPNQTINAVQAVFRARSETDVASIAPILISGATTDTGTSQTTVLGDYYDTKQQIYDVDPNTSAKWTETNVNAVKGGYKNAT